MNLTLEELAIITDLVGSMGDVEYNDIKFKSLTTPEGFHNDYVKIINDMPTNYRFDELYVKLSNLCKIIEPIDKYEYVVVYKRGLDGVMDLSNCYFTSLDEFNIATKAFGYVGIELIHATKRLKYITQPQTFTLRSNTK